LRNPDVSRDPVPGTQIEMASERMPFLFEVILNVRPSSGASIFFHGRDVPPQAGSRAHKITKALKAPLLF